MKTSMVLVFSSILLCQCSSPKIQDDSKFTETEDSIVSDFADSFEDDSLKYNLTLTTALETALKETARECKEKSLYNLTTNFTGYENNAVATYYFDSTLSLTSCRITWNSEGDSGSYDYFFEGDSLKAGKEENDYNGSEETVWLHVAFKPTYGFMKTDGSEADPNVTYLGESDFLTKNIDARNEFSRLLDRIRDYQDSVSINNDLVTLQIENIVNYGDDFTEREEFSISKEVFDKLIRN